MAKVFCSTCTHLETVCRTTSEDERYRCMPEKHTKDTWFGVEEYSTYEIPRFKNKKNNCPDYEKYKAKHLS